MFEQIDLERSLKKSEYRQLLPELQTRLFDMEQAVLEYGLPVLIVFEGWAGTAKIRTIGALTRRLDPRGVRVHPITPPRTYETHYPWLYRFWLKIPRYGQIAVFDRSWYREMIAQRAGTRYDPQRWLDQCSDVAAFERQLSDDGAVIIKFWLHISKKEQAQRFAKITADPLTAHQITAEDRRQHRHYQRVRDAVEDLIARTDAPFAPWHIVPATDKYFARIAVLQTVLGALEARFDRPAVALTASAYSKAADTSSSVYRRSHEALNERVPQPVLHLETEMSGNHGHPTVSALRRVDLSQSIDEQTYGAELKYLQARIYRLGLMLYQQKRPAVLVFEGWDAAGKGGAIQRLTAELDPRSYTVHAIAAPAGDDKVRHYLYRFWRRLPPRGAIAIFDRSWYGRVMVERIEGFARPDEWKRAYAEINDFERQLIEFGTIICKFWLHISPEEQLRRFEERQTVPYKAWKLTDEDWRNREKWGDYEQAVDEMLLRTSTPIAPWTVVESEDKRHGRIKVLRTVVQRMEAVLGHVEL